MEQNFQNPQIFDLDIPDFSDLKLTAVSPKYLQIILLNITLFSVFMTVGVSIAFYFFYFNLSTIQIWAVVTGVLLLIVFLFLNAVIGFKYRKYAIRENDIVYQHGWLKRTLIIIPFNRIQHIKVKQGWLSKILQLKSVSVYTAAITGDVSVNGLPEETAEGINNLIRKNIASENIEDGAGA